MEGIYHPRRWKLYFRGIKWFKSYKSYEPKIQKIGMIIGYLKRIEKLSTSTSRFMLQVKLITQELLSKRNNKKSYSWNGKLKERNMGRCLWIPLEKWKILYEETIKILKEYIIIIFGQN